MPFPGCHGQAGSVRSRRHPDVPRSAAAPFDRKPSPGQTARPRASGGERKGATASPTNGQAGRLCSAPFRALPASFRLSPRFARRRAGLDSGGQRSVRQTAPSGGDTTPDRALPRGANETEAHCRSPGAGSAAMDGRTCAIWSGMFLRLNPRYARHTSRNSVPAPASSRTTIQGGAFQTVSSKKPASATAKSAGASTAPVHTG